MRDTVRRYVEAGREALTPKKAEQLARGLAEEGKARADQVQKLAKDLVEWSRKNSERLRETIRGEVQKQLARAGVATRADVESLKRRLRKVEAEAKPKRASRSPAKKTSAGRPRKATGGSTRSSTTA